MSDLQCAATILLTPHRDADGEGRALARSLREAHLALIYTSPTPPAVQTAEVVAAETGVPVVVRDTLRDGVRRDGPDLDEEADEQVRARMRAELETIADAHRGETVLVVSHARAIRATLPALVGLADHVRGSRPGPALVELAADSDGWVLRGWASELRPAR